MADKTNLDGEKLKAALHQFAEVGLCRRKNWPDKTLTKKKKLQNGGMYFIASMLLLFFLVVGTFRRR